MTSNQIIDLIEVISDLTEENKLMQKIAKRHKILTTVSEIFQSKWVQVQCGSDRLELEEK